MKHRASLDHLRESIERLRLQRDAAAKLKASSRFDHDGYRQAYTAALEALGRDRLNDMMMQHISGKPPNAEDQP